MPTDKFLIGYTDQGSGLQSDLKPWLINDNAFQNLENAYVYRGRVRKRFGSSWMGQTQLETRLRINVGSTTDGSLSGTVPGTIFEVGQMFSVGSDILTVNQAGTPATLLTNGVVTGTYNTSTGDFTIAGASGTVDVWFYPSDPVMGLSLYYTPSTGNYLSMGFDTQFSYQYDDVNNNWFRLDTGVATWTGSNSQFFWMTNYQGATDDLTTFWVTNFNPTDGIRYFDGVTWFQPVLNYTRGDSIGTTDGSGNSSGTVTGPYFIGQVFTIGLTNFIVTALGTPATLTVSSGGTGTGTLNTTTGAYTFTGAQANTTIYFTGDNFITTAQLIIQFRNRLLLLNTIETVDGVATSYVNRMRYSAIGSPLASQAWMQDIPGQGGAIDAPTVQAIITAQFIKDRLIVYFEASTYELVYTGNQVQPFQWQKINTELGATSTFSQIPFDKQVLGIDDVGIHGCNGANVERIDTKIPNVVWSFDTEFSGSNRVAGIRDYYTELAYWTYLSSDRNESFQFPNQILVYNYVNDSWAINDDSFTTFGYYLFQVGAPGATWGNTTTPWGNNTSLWNSSSSATNNVKSKKIVAGNQQGFVSIIDSDLTSNASAMQVTDFSITGNGDAVFTIINHNLQLNDFILVENMYGISFTDSNGNILSKVMCQVITDTVNNQTTDTFTALLLDNELRPVTITGSYVGAGTAARVSEINILSKQYNFYTAKDRNVYVSKIDFLVDRTDIGSITADYFISSTNISIVNEGLGTVAAPGPLIGNNVLETSPYALVNLEQFQDRLWHPIYFSADGECVQLQLYLSPAQLYDYVIDDSGMQNFVALQDFQMHAMLIYAQPTSNRMQ